MCWNQDVSINTFGFACLALLFIYITNKYTKYKTKTFDNPLVYLFLFAVASMQLIEFFLWRNLNDKTINKNLSTMAAFLIIIQQLVLMFMIKNINIRYILLLVYALFVIFVGFSQKANNFITFNTFVGNNGHLSWEWMNHKKNETSYLFIWLLFYLLPLLLVKNNLLTLFVMLSMIITLAGYYKYNTFGTMWCWSSNFFLLYFIVDIILIKPYLEYNGAC